jgi:hypothetical protein
MMIKKPIVFLSKQSIPKGAHYQDVLILSQEELFKIRHPHLAKQLFKDLSEWRFFLKSLQGSDCWIYWPTGKIAVHILKEDLYFELRTARNKNLITKKEQEIYRNATVGIAGLSVGSSILHALVLSGGPKTIKIADFDILEPTNLNRIRGGISDLGFPKIEIAAREVWCLDPFANLKLYPKGLTEETIERFMLSNPRLDIFIDEMDNLALKVSARLIAKKKRMPVIMATDNGDGILLDVERFDLEPKRPIFHGLAGNLTIREARNAQGQQWLSIVKKIIGGPWMPERHRLSLMEIGKTLAGVPQLGTDAMTAGSAISLVVRKILNNDPMPSGRYVVAMDKILQKPLVS